jgi:hypothetical protein
LTQNTASVTYPRLRALARWASVRRRKDVVGVSLIKWVQSSQNLIEEGVSRKSVGGVLFCFGVKKVFVFQCERFSVNVSV